MKKSTRALVGMVLLDGLFVAGTGWLVWQIKSGVAKTSVPPEEAISTITSIGGGAIGIITVVLALAWLHHRRGGN